MWNITAETFSTNPEECLNYIKANWDKIPVLNWFPDYHLRDGQLIKFRGMIQDMPNPIYYYSSYEVINNVTRIKETRSGKYRDSLNCREDETLILESENCFNLEKQLYTCISIPALNEWAQPRYLDPPNSVDSNSVGSVKRNAEYMEADDDIAGQSKRLCTSNTPVSTGSERSLINQQSGFPIPSHRNYLCIVHVYDIEDNNLKVNDIIETCGFIHFNSTDINLFDNDSNSLLNLPRLHAVSMATVKSFIPFPKIELKLDEVFSDARRLRSELHLILTQLLLGDLLAAEYLICHLITHVYARPDCTVLGKFSVNLSNVPANPEYTTKVYKLVSSLLPKTHYIPMSLELMNTIDMIPKKNYEIDRLQTGMLQLSDHTHLVIDETKLEVGKLEQKGVQNVQALKSIIEHQKLDYDFKFFTVEFITDIPVLILSEGKSLLPSDCHIVLQPEEEFTSSSTSLDECFAAIEKYLQEPLLNLLRNYIAAIVGISDFTLPDHLHKIIENDLVEQRQAGERTTADDFHARLVLARLMTLSFGEKVLTKHIWDKTGIMETERKLRLNIKKK